MDRKLYLLDKFDFIKHIKELSKNSKIYNALDVSSTQLFRMLKDDVFSMEISELTFISKRKYSLKISEKGELCITIFKNNLKITTSNNYHLESLFYFDGENIENQLKMLKSKYNKNVHYIPKSENMNLYTSFHQQFDISKTINETKEIVEYLSNNNKMLVHSLSGFKNHRVIEYSGKIDYQRIFKLLKNEKNYYIVNLQYPFIDYGCVHPNNPQKLLIRVNI